MNIWVNTQFLARQKQSKLPGDWEELQQELQATVVYFQFKANSNYKTELISIIRCWKTENRSPEDKQNVFKIYFQTATNKHFQHQKKIMLILVWAWCNLK